MARLLREWREGVIVGLYTAALFSVWAAVVWFVGGEDGRASVPIPLTTLVAGYFLAGLLGGSAYGIFYPLRRHLAGAIALGVVVCTLVYGVVALLFVPPEDWAVAVPVAAVFCGVIAGPISGAMFWYYSVARRKK